MLRAAFAMRNITHSVAPAALLGALALWPAGSVEVAAAAPSHSISGRLVLVEKGRPARDRRLDLTQAAVWYEPDRGASRPEPIDVEMLTVRKQFSPQILVVPVGSTVRFPNRDPILHNVFSVSSGNSFDLGLVGAGGGKSAVFRRDGIVQVFCNVHHGMFAHVVVVGTPYYARPDARGEFVIEGVPAGVGTLRFWHERAEPSSSRALVPQRTPLTIELEVTVPRVPPHLNKFGRRYGRGSYG